MTHLREIAAGLANRAPKEEALIALRLLRDAQRRVIEEKQKEWIKVSDADDTLELLANALRERNLELPPKLRRRREDNFPMVLKDAVSVEDAIDREVCDLLQGITKTVVECDLTEVQE